MAEVDSQEWAAPPATLEVSVDRQPLVLYLPRGGLVEIRPTIGFRRAR